jgi:hypothetical protein
MRNIYGTASRVIVWLGGDQEPEDKLLEGLFVDNRKNDLVGEGNEETSGTADIFLAKLGDYALKNDVSILNKRIEFPETMKWACLARIFNRAWFKRMWVVQEVAMAAKAEGFFGGFTVPWDAIVLTARFLIKYSLDGPNRQIVKNMGALFVSSANICYDPGLGIQNATFVPTQRLLHLMYITKDQKATDPRDRIYALLDLTTDAMDGCLVQAAYSESLGYVYADLVRALI